jgi:hypothetical protein
MMVAEVAAAVAAAVELGKMACLVFCIRDP